jgi:hypothetical protein
MTSTPFKQLTPEVLWDEWDILRALMCPVQEDVVTTGSIEITDKPLLPKKKPKKVKIIQRVFINK